MIGVSDYLKKLLYEQDCVVVPDLGGFLSHFNHAFYSGVNGLYHSPAKRVAFNEALKLDDGLLIHHITVNEQINREDAQRRVSQFVDEVKAAITKQGSYQLSDIGLLLFNQEGKLLFEPNIDINFFQEGYGLKSVSANALTSQISVEDNQPIQDLEDRLPVEQPAKPNRRRSKVAMYSSGLLLIGGLFYASSDTPLSSSSTSSFNPLDLFVKKTKIQMVNKPLNLPSDNVKIDSEINIADVEVIEKKSTVPSKAKSSVKIINDIKPELVVIDVSKLKVQVQSADYKDNQKQVSDTDASFFVIAGAFANQENAQRLVDRLRLSGYADASIMMIDERNLYKVSAVGLSSQARAVGQMSRINKLSKAQSWIFVAK